MAAKLGYLLEYIMGQGKNSEEYMDLVLRMRTPTDVQRSRISFIIRNQLRWLGHVKRLPAERILKKLLKGKPGGRRNRGGLRKR